MKRTLICAAALAAVVCCAKLGAAQDLVRVYAPETIPYIGSTTDFGYGLAPVYRAANYAPVTSYYAPATTTYYAPATTTYYAPATTTYYAPAVPTTTYYAPATTAYYAPTTAYYAPAAAVVPYRSYYAPAYYGRAYYYAPAPYVPGQPIRNAFRAAAW